MRTLKLFSTLFLALLLFASCEKEATQELAFFSKQELKKDLPIRIDNTNGSTVNVNSNGVLGLHAAQFFCDNLNNLKDLDVQKINIKVKNFTIDPTVSLSNVKIFVDELDITDLIDINDFTALTTGFEIRNSEFLAAVSSKLLQKKQVVVSYYGDAATNNQFNFDVEVMITAQGTFLDY